MVTTSCLWLGSEGWGRWVEPRAAASGLAQGPCLCHSGSRCPAGAEACYGTLLGALGTSLPCQWARALSLLCPPVE